MSLAELERSLADGPPALVYVVLGDQALLVERAEAMITASALDGGMAAFNQTVFRAGDEGAAEAPAVARTLPMMAARRLVVVRDVEEAPVELLKSLRDLCQAPSPTTVLVLTGQKWPKPTGGEDWGRRLEGLVKKVGVVLRFKAKDQDPVGFAVDTARELGCRLDRDAATVLVEMVGKDLGLLQRELEKACLYLGGEGTLTPEVLAEVCSLLAEAQVWDLTDAIVVRDVDRALSTAHRLLEAGKKGESHRLLALITWQIRQLLTLQQAMRGDEVEGLRMPGWKRREAERALRASPLRTADVLERIGQANQDMNSHRAGDRRILEGLILDLASRR
ncbi:MAG: DNA polymerase III subunit delta [Alphaproteobacteria bacterium]|nr:DNA polymerase III subunit delta [Alphaproteobacteria bacterium]